MTQLTVIGVGNRLRGDDALGPLIIDALANQADPRLELIDAGSDALGVLEYLEGREQVMLIDACRMGRIAGELVQFEPAEVNLILTDDPLSLHGLGLAETLQMATSLHLLPPILKIIGIQPETTQFNSQLSAPALQALDQAIQQVYTELRQIAESIIGET